MKKILTITEVMQALLDGKKITNKHWFNYEYIYFDKKKNIFFDEEGEIESNIFDLFEDEFFLYEESKKKTFYKVDYLPYEGALWTQTNNYFESINDFNKFYTGYISAKLNESTKIVIEDNGIF